MTPPSALNLNRRQFTKTTLLAGAAVACGASSTPGQDTKRVRVGIIGCGSVSNSYLPVLTKCPHARSEERRVGKECRSRTPEDRIKERWIREGEWRSVTD